MQCLARERGRRCLSATYINNRHPLVWECKRRHRWKATPANVKGGERKRGTWCLECYNLRRRFRTRDSIERMKKLARRRGGICLSKEYINSKTKLLWECGNGHRWRAVPVAIKSGSWCPECARNQKLTLGEFQWLAARKGGRCLSHRYTNKEAPLRCECALRHRSSAQPGRVKRGTWCAKCAQPFRDGVGGNRVSGAAGESAGDRDRRQTLAPSELLDDAGRGASGSGCYGSFASSTLASVRMLASAPCTCRLP